MLLHFFRIRNNKRYAQKGVSTIAHTGLTKTNEHHIRRQHAFSDCLIFSAKQVFNTKPPIKDLAIVFISFNQQKWI